MTLLRSFGRTGLSVSPLGFGAGHIGDPSRDEALIAKLLNEALDLGVRFFDTARGYGLSEERIGRHLAHRRREFVLATKCGYGVPPHADWTPACIASGVDEALKRLRTDYLDVMLLHSCPRSTLTADGVIEALEQAQRAGKVRFIGYSGENEDLSFAVDSGRFQVIECSVNLFDQRALSGTIARATAAGIAVIAKRPLGNAPWRFASRPSGDYAETYWDRMTALAIDPSPMKWDELCLRFAAFASGVGTAIVGTGRLEHLRRAVEIITRGPLDGALAEELRSLFKERDRDWIGQL